VSANAPAPRITLFRTPDVNVFGLMPARGFFLILLNIYCNLHANIVPLLFQNVSRQQRISG
jgi:hypothetical protein